MSTAIGTVLTVEDGTMVIQLANNKKIELVDFSLRFSAGDVIPDDLLQVFERMVARNSDSDTVTLQR